jgi:hypothetical protein
LRYGNPKHEKSKKKNQMKEKLEKELEMGENFDPTLTLLTPQT